MRLKRFLLGDPLLNEGVSHEPLPKWKAISTLSADALSSVAYASEAMFAALAVFSAAALIWSVPVSLAIIGLLAVLIASYRRTVAMHPVSGGAYHVARENLGTYAGLVAGASLMVDYVLTVSVSVAAGVENIASAIPWLYGHRVIACVVMIMIITVLNLRGTKESAGIYVLPTYFFIISIAVLIGTGVWKLATGEAPSPPSPFARDIYPVVPALLVLRAFASGCAALAGIETIAGNTASFQIPTARNARATLLWMSIILAAFFFGITLLAYEFKLVPSEQETLISMLGRTVLGGGAAYYIVQLAVSLVLFQAANSSYVGFPRLASELARDRYLPRQMAGIGDRLVFSNGIIGLGIASAILLAVFGGDTSSIIPLYAVGVFLSFTLSQGGMVAFHLRERKPGWHKSIVLNMAGAFTTSIVLAEVIFMKFAHGAWFVVLVIPCMVLFFSRINKHYCAVGKELSDFGQAPPLRFKPVKHTVIIPISGIHRGVIEALRYALSISNDVRACYVEIDTSATERMMENWNKWAPEIPFVVLKSPFRSIVRPLIKYVEDVEHVSQDDMVTIVVPEFITSRWWHRILHNQTALFLKAALAMKRGKVVTTVRYHLKNT
ncbi:MAG: hypothetical protein A2583_07375 [Bdellovibrionales bacterium RIFOXYD1_FULL_53_11]|nr:MAG: hypothetical protein A2583_07375 [Bdellovibrionales bacterium RIFOXYD1_FULL_53_11]